MDRKVIKNYLYNTIYQLLIVAVPIVTTPYISRVLSVGDLGIYSYSLTIMTYFTLVASLGFHIYGQKRIAISVTKQEENKIFSQILTLKLYFGLGVSAFYFILVAFVFPHKIVYLAQGIGLIAVNFDISWYFAGKENFKKLTIRNICIKLLSVVLLFLVVRNGNELLKYTLTISVPNLIGNLLLFWKLDVMYIKPKLTAKLIKSIMLNSIMLFLPSLLQQLYSVIDTTLLGALRNDEQVGFYSQTFKMINMMSMFSYSIGTVLLPRITSEYNNGNIEKFRENMQDAVLAVFHLSIPLMAGLISISDIFVPWFYGDKYYSLILLLVLASPLIVVTSLSNMIGTQFLIAVNREKILVMIIIIGSCVNIGFDYVFIPNFGAKGAIYATLIAEFLIMLLDYISFRQILKTSMFNVGMLKSVMSAFAMYGTIIFLKQALALSGVISTLLLVVVGGVVYFVVLFVLQDELIIKMKTFLTNRHG